MEGVPFGPHGGGEPGPQNIVNDRALLPLCWLYTLCFAEIERAPLQQNLVVQSSFCCPFGLAFSWTARYPEAQLSPVRRRPLRERLMPPGAAWARGGVPGLQRKTAQSGFVLEGVRQDYSGSMSVFPCRGTFRRLAVVGLCAKTQQPREQPHCTRTRSRPPLRHTQPRAAWCLLVPCGIRTCPCSACEPAHFRT